MRKRYLAALALICGFLFLVFYHALFRMDTQPAAPLVKDNAITIFWAEWTPADLLQQLTESFTRETGIKVTIVQESWTRWQHRFFDEMKNRGQAFDMVVGDSQWLGRGAMNGHYVALTRWIMENGVHETMTPASIRGYSEFPKGSGQYWAVPLEGDAMGFSYRRDLFEDPDERAAFSMRYGYPLAVPETFEELRDIAEFFHRPEQGFYGILVWTEPFYDGITMGVDALIWAWGGTLGNRSNFQVAGHINSKAGVKALRFYRELNRFNNPDWEHHYLDTHSSSNQPMMAGAAAMTMCYFAIAPEMLDPKKNPYYDRIGFFSTPRGPGGQATSLGGQGISIVSYSKKKALCLRFLSWFIRRDVQEAWAKLGGLSCDRRVLDSDWFVEASPVNRPYRDSIRMVRDFWAVPEYPELLAVSQEQWSRYVRTGKPSAEETMDITARQWEEIFDRAGYYRE